MLGKVLHAAEQQHRQEQSTISAASANLNREGKGLATHIHEEYGSITKSDDDDDDDYDGSGIEDSTTFAFGEDEEEDVLDEDSSRRDHCCLKLIYWIHSLFLAVANVENLWDSPTNRRTKKTWFVVLFWFTLLAVSYALERTTFKLLVDRMGPFRLFSAVVLTGSHALFLSMGLLIGRLVRKTWGRGFRSLGIPVVDVGLMALLDTVHLVLVFISGSHIPPTLIVILVQLTIPLTCLFAQFVHPDGCFARNRQVDSSHNLNIAIHPPLRGCGGLTAEHVIGSLIITVAVLAGMSPAIITFFEPEVFMAMDVLPLRTALNTLIFTFACIPAAASQLFKEHVFLQHKQPVDPSQFNLILSLFQFIFLLIISPLVYGLQGLSGATHSDRWTTLYPSSQIRLNFQDGFKCLLGTLDEVQQESGYPEDAECDYILLIVIFHVLSILIIGIAVDKIVNAGATKVMYRGTSAGIVLAVISLYTYDMHDPDFNYGPVIDSLHFVCTLTLILGSEVYHRVSLQDATFETVYPEMESLYDLGGN